ncbi:MAG: dihydroorotase, partial [Coriobacteriales bacterium]
GMMRRGMDYAKAFGLPVLAHCQRESLVGTGVVNEGVASTRLGMAGWPAEGEEVEIARDVMLCRLTGCRLHVQHVTTERGLKLVEDARTQGLPVTCEVTPHHLFLCEDDITDDFDTNLKVNPPLRTRADMECLQQALCDGRIDCVSTDHAPHAAHEKALEFELAPFGTTGLETALGLLWTELVSTGRLGLDRLVEAMAVRPRALLGLAPVTLASGSAADLTVIDPDMKTKVEKSWFESRSDNSAFLGRELTGGASDVMVAGRFRLRDGKVVR